MPGPTPDFDMVTAVWTMTLWDGTAPRGKVVLKYDGGDVLDSDSVRPILVRPVDLTADIVEKTVTVQDKNGNPVLKVVGEATFNIPASNDPDILGGGGTYSVTEQLTNAPSRPTYHFFADIDAPSGIIQIAPLGPGTGTNPGEPISVVTISEFVDLRDRVTDLEQNPVTAGTVTSVNGKTPITGGAVTLVKGDIGLGNVTDTADSAKPVSTAQQAALDLKADLVSGKVPTSQLPTFSQGATFTAASQAAMLALSGAAVGDFAVRSDLSNQPFRLAALPASTLGNWIAFGTTPSVTSVAGKTGTVALAKADVGLGNVDNTSDANKPVSSAAAAAIAPLMPTVLWDATNHVWVGTLDPLKAGAYNSLNDSAATAPPLSSRLHVWLRRPVGV